MQQSRYDWVSCLETTLWSHYDKDSMHGNINETGRSIIVVVVVVDGVVVILEVGLDVPLVVIVLVAEVVGDVVGVVDWLLV